MARIDTPLITPSLIESVNNLYYVVKSGITLISIKESSSLVLLLVFSIAFEIVSVRVMDVIGQFYDSMAKRESRKFVASLTFAMVTVSALAILKSLVFLTSEICSLQWRFDLTNFVHSIYFKPMHIRRNIFSCINTDLNLDNCDQRISQDIMDWSQKAAELLQKMIVLPALIVFYTSIVYHALGFLPTFICYAYFGFTTVISTYSVRLISSLVFVQLRLNADFRSIHKEYFIRCSEIQLMQSEDFEARKIDEIFQYAIKNQAKIAIFNFFLSFIVNFFEYSGSIVNYAAIGIAFFYVQKSSNAISNFSEAEAAAFVARNSFACLYLINCFSKIFECCQIATELFGSSRRIAELIERSREDDLTSVVSTKSNYPSLLQRFNDTILKCFRNDRDAPTNYSLLSCDDESVELCEPNVYIPPFGKRMADGNAVRMSKINGKDILLEVENLKLISPNGDLLLNSLAFSVTNEMRLLIKGKSGCGKSTLLRYLAFGIRTNSSKTNSITANSIKCYIRKENIIFLPQQSRCVQGTLMDNLLYPFILREQIENKTTNWQKSFTRRMLNDVARAVQHPNQILDLTLSQRKFMIESAKSSLELMGFEHFTIHSDKSVLTVERDWGNVLSCGEQQKLWMTRIIFQLQFIYLNNSLRNFNVVSKNNFLLVFLDECSSAMDEESEKLAYMKLNSLIGANGAIISIGHRRSLHQYHNYELTLSTQGGEMIEIKCEKNSEPR